MNGVNTLSGTELDITLQCLKYIFEAGPFEVAADCSPRIGVSPEEFQKVLDDWPNVDDAVGTNAFLVINNCLNEVCNGPDTPSEEKWSEYFSTTREEIEAVYEKWAKSLELDSTGIR